jgi:hypothetical protein
MKRRVNLSLVILALIAGVIGISFYLKRYSAVASIPTPGVDISNETEHFQVVSAIINANVLNLMIKNTSSEPIIAYRIDFNPDGNLRDGIDSDLSFSESLFPPQAVMTLFLPLNKLKRKETGNYYLNIAMAYFVNGWAEGSWEKSKLQQEKFEGIDKALRDVRGKMPHTKDSFAKFGENTFKKGAPAYLSPGQKLGYLNAINHIWVTSFQIAQKDKNENDAALHITALQSKLERISARNNAFVKDPIGERIK